LRVRLGSALELSGRVVDRPERQQTLRSTIEWSYSLLTPDLQRSFRRLGVFAGPFDLGAVDAVITGTGSTAGADPLDVIGDLVDASLARLAEETDSEPRFRVLQTIAAFARDKLTEHGELDEIGRLHAEHFLGVVDALPTQRDGATHLLARRRIEAELGNLRAALQWALGDPTQPIAAVPTPAGDDRAQIGLHLCRALSWFWYVCGYQSEGRRWLERAVELAGDDRSDELMGSMHMLGVLLQQQGEWEPSRTTLELCLDYWRARGNVSFIARELNSLGCGHRSVGEAQVARALFVESIRYARESGAESRVATALSNLAILEVDELRPAIAIDLLNEALDIDQRSGDSWGVVHDECNLAGAMMQAGRSAEAWQTLRDHAAEVLELGDTELTITVIELFGQSLAELGDATTAARLLGASQQLRVRAELPIQVPDAAILAISIDKVRDQPDKATWAANLEAGRSYSAEQAMAEAVIAR
jgi:tetratricopeptide (TPR) repeat protein